MQQYQSILEFSSGRYFRIALLLCTGAIAAYAWHEPPTVYFKPNGGTWLGYTLGTIAALMVVWLMMLGVRKRRYASNAGTLRGWTSAHVYLGTTLIVIATLHCAFEFGLNIHTLAYVLMMAVIVSGFYGVYAYLRFPNYMTANLSGDTLETLLLKVSDLERKCTGLALDLDDDANTLVRDGLARARRRSALGGSYWRQLSNNNTGYPIRRARDDLLKMAGRYTGGQGRALEQLIAELSRMVTLVGRVNRDLRFRALLQLWLYFHVPLSFALLAALAGHIVSVFYFW